MMRPRALVRPSSGYTLIEAVIGLAVISSFMAAMGGVVASTFGAYTEMTASLAAEELTNRLTDRIVWELRFAPLETVQLAQPTDARSITYSRVVGWEAEAPILSGPQTISLAGGKVLQNGIPIAEGVKDLILNLSGRTLTAVVEVERTAHVRDSARVFAVSREVKVSF